MTRKGKLYLQTLLPQHLMEKEEEWNFKVVEADTPRMALIPLDGIERFHITKISLEFLQQECAIHPSSKARNNHTKDNT